MLHFDKDERLVTGILNPMGRANRDVDRLAGRYDNVAIVAYKVHEELTVDGHNVTLDATDASMWIRCNGRRVCALHTESITGDPFGRDRHPAG